MPTGEWFHHYADHHFGTVELNVPFYSTLGTLETWRKQAEGREMVSSTVKASELITRVKRYKGTKTLVRDFSYGNALVPPSLQPRGTDPMGACRIRKAHAQRVWVYFNNDFNGYAIKNATMLAEILSVVD